MQFKDISRSAFIYKEKVFELEWFYYEKENDRRLDNFNPVYFRIKCESLNYSSKWRYKNSSFDGTNTEFFKEVRDEIDELDLD